MSKPWYAAQTKKSGDCRGSEADRSKSQKWCKLCYGDGKFVNPNGTLGEVRVIVDDELKQNGSDRLMRWLAQKQLPRLERWKNSK